MQSKQPSQLKSIPTAVSLHCRFLQIPHRMRGRVEIAKDCFMLGDWLSVFRVQWVGLVIYLVSCRSDSSDAASAFRLG